MNLPHGTVGRSRQGCKCRLCRMAHERWAEGQKERNKASGYGSYVKPPKKPASQRADHATLSDKQVEEEVAVFAWLEEYFQRLHEEEQMLLEQSLFRHVRRIH